MAARGAPASAKLDLRPTRDGTLLRLKVRAGGRQDAVLGVHAGALKISVCAPAERGKANRAVLELLGRALELRPGLLELVSGRTRPDKTVRVPLSPEETERRLHGRRAPGRP
jgi:uncharacterized protein (TIGR00251 family)